jgi:hypothetical protein
VELTEQLLEKGECLVDRADLDRDVVDPDRARHGTRA